MKFKGLLMSASLLVSAYLAQGQTYESDFQQRRTLLINQLTQANFQLTNISDPEKHNWPKVIARLVRYGNSDTNANRLISRFKNNPPFHFTLVGMARIMGQFPLADSLVPNRNRYLQNVFNRLDGYNAFTGEGTENHINMSRTSGYLYAQYALGNPLFPQASRKLADTKSWILYYSKRIYQTGTGEWNSSVYQSYSIAGWLNLYDLAADVEVRNAARAVLDYYTAESALHTFYGITSGAEMRGSSSTSTVSGYDYLSWMWFGNSPKDQTASSFWTPKEYSQSVHAAVSTYRPNPIAVSLALKQISLPAYYQNSKPDYDLTQVGYIQQNFYQNQDFNVGTAYVPYGGFTNGDFQIVNWKMVGKPGPANTSAQMVTGNGRYWANNGQGKWRNPYDQFMQHKNVVVQMSRVPTDTARINALVKPLVRQWAADWLRDFNLRFPAPNNLKDGGNPVQATATLNTSNPNSVYISYPPTTQTVRKSGVMFIELDRFYIAIRTLALDSASGETNEPNSSTRKFVLDQALLGQICGTVAEAGSKTEYANLAAFQTAIFTRTRLGKADFQTSHRLYYKTLAGDSLSVHYNTAGSFTEPIFDWGYGVTTQQIITQATPWQEPAWPSGEGFGKVADWTINGQAFTPATAVFSGPGLSQTGGVLRYSDGTAFYQVDYTGMDPVFTSSVVAAKLIAKQERPVVSPNPNKGLFTIGVNSAANTLGDGQLYTINGKLVKRFSMQATNTGALVDLHSVLPGNYIIKYSWMGKPFSDKIVIE